MSGRRVTAGGLAVGTMAAALVLAFTPPSHADRRELLVSNNANGPFRDNLSTPLFDALGQVVPRDRADTTLYVMNNSSQAARTTLAIVNPADVTTLERALTFDVHIHGARSAGTAPVPDEDACSMVTTGPTIAPGEIQAIDIALAVADLQGREGMGQAASIDFVVSLTQTGENGWVEVCGNQADAEPDIRGSEIVDPDPNQPSQAPLGDRCDRDLVVTAVGSPTCVPTAVDAGVSEAQQRARRTLTVFAAILFAFGAGMLARAIQRRLDSDAPR